MLTVAQLRACLFLSFTVLLGTCFQLIAFVFQYKLDTYSVFAQKSNPLNVFLAKYAWGWTSIPLLAFMLVYVHTCTTTTINSSTYKRYAAVAIRWTSATLYWVIMTQWAFGNPLLDRVYLSTGHCLTMTNTVEVRSIRQCKSLGGSLTGLDISGHCFLLVHAILTTFEELKPYFKLHTLDSSSALMAHFTSLSKMCLSILSLVLITLGLIWWIMLFTTSLYFHSFIEASSGTLLGMLHWLVLYVVTGSLYPNVLPFDVSLVSQPNKSQKHL